MFGKKGVGNKISGADKYGGAEEGVAEDPNFLDKQSYDKGDHKLRSIGQPTPQGKSHKKHWKEIKNSSPEESKEKY
jgi:hypothetical protein